MTIDIVIPNYNGAHLLEKNLHKVWESLKKYAGTIIIVDDGSMIEDCVTLEKLIDRNKKDMKLKFIKHKFNMGFSSAVNSGVIASKADFVVLLNSDVVPRSDFLKNPLKRLGDDKNLFGVGCMDESIEEDKKIFRGRGLAKWRNGFLEHFKGDVTKNEDTFWISGGSSVIRRSIFYLLGGFDEIYNPFYWEDIDLSYRAQKAGYKIIFDRESIVTHYHDEGAIKENFKMDAITTISYRNQFIFIWKNISDAQLLIDHFVRLPKHLLGALLRRDNNFLKGFFLAIKSLPAIIKKRRLQKNLYKLSDEIVIRNIS